MVREGKGVCTSALIEGRSITLLARAQLRLIPVKPRRGRCPACARNANWRDKLPLLNAPCPRRWRLQASPAGGAPQRPNASHKKPVTKRRPQRPQGYSSNGILRLRCRFLEFKRASLRCVTLAFAGAGSRCAMCGHRVAPRGAARSASTTVQRSRTFCRAISRARPTARMRRSCCALLARRRTECVRWPAPLARAVGLAAPTRAKVFAVAWAHPVPESGQ
jgi:hypothetical protein